MSSRSEQLREDGEAPARRAWPGNDRMTERGQRTRELGVQLRGQGRGGAEAGRALGLAGHGSLADSHRALWAGWAGRTGHQIASPPCAGQAEARAGLAEPVGALVIVCLSARLENGQLQEDGGRRGQGMEYPPGGLVSCWGRKLLRVKVPPPDTGVWGGGP